MRDVLGQGLHKHVNVGFWWVLFLPAGRKRTHNKRKSIMLPAPLSHRQLPNEWGGPRDAGTRERGGNQGSIHAALHKRYPGVRSQDTTLNPIVVERQLGSLVEVIQNMLSID